MRSIWGGDGSSVFVQGLAQRGSDLYGIPLRIYGEKPPWRSCSKETPSEKGHGITEAHGNTSGISSRVCPLQPNLPVKDVSHLTLCHEMSPFSSTGALGYPPGNKMRLWHFLGNWLLVDWMNPASPCSLSSGRRTKGTSRSHLLADDLLGREKRWGWSLGGLCWCHFH